MVRYDVNRVKSDVNRVKSDVIMVKSDVNSVTCFSGDEQMISRNHFHCHTIGIRVKDGLLGVGTRGVEKGQEA